MRNITLFITLLIVILGCDSFPDPQPLADALRGSWTIDEIKRDYYTRDSISILTEAGTLEFLVCDTDVYDNKYCQAIYTYDTVRLYDYRPFLNQRSGLIGSLVFREPFKNEDPLRINSNVYSIEQKGANQFILSYDYNSLYLTTAMLTRINE